MRGDGDGIEATEAQLRAFRRAAAALDRLGKQGLHIYMAPGSLCLLGGPSHDGHGSARQDRVLEEGSVTNGSGGDW